MEVNGVRRWHDCSIILLSPSFMSNCDVFENENYTVPDGCSNDFSAHLLFLRTKNGLSQKLLAEILDLKSYSSISDYESGRTNPSFPVLMAIADLFAVTIDWLVGRSVFSKNGSFRVDSNRYSLIPLLNKVTAEYSRIKGTPFYINVAEEPERMEELLPVLSDVIFCKNILLHAHTTTKEIFPKLDFDELAFDDISLKLIPKLTERDGKKTTLQRLELWTSCIDKLSAYINN